MAAEYLTTRRQCSKWCHPGCGTRGNLGRANRQRDNATSGSADVTSSSLHAACHVIASQTQLTTGRTFFLRTNRRLERAAAAVAACDWNVTCARISSQPKCRALRCSEGISCQRCLQPQDFYFADRPCLADRSISRTRNDRFWLWPGSINHECPWRSTAPSQVRCVVAAAKGIHWTLRFWGIVGASFISLKINKELWEKPGL